ncbi:hypothetical protein PG984_015088 [Apiospora sp. TS-2023a]
METVTPRCRTRLRRACDGCSVAKVKCDRKDLAACDRCQLNEMDCTFSVSRRYGKQSWAKRVASASQWSTESHPPQHQQHDQRAQAGGSDVYLFSALDAGDVVFDGAPFWSEDGFASTYGDMTIDMDMTSTEHNSLPRQLQGHEGLPFGDESRTTTATSSSLASVSSAASASASRSLPTSLSRTTPSGQDTAPRYSHPHDCEAQALALLQSLQHSPGAATHSSPTTASSNSSSSGGTDPKPNLDEVLLVNKAALQRFTQLVDCPCVVTPHLALLYLALLAKMLFWYREAATGDCVDRLQPTQIRMGMLDLDDEDQANLLRVILLRELRKVEALVERLARLALLSSASAAGHGVDGGGHGRVRRDGHAGSCPSPGGSSSGGDGKRDDGQQGSPHTGGGTPIIKDPAAIGTRRPRGPRTITTRGRVGAASLLELPTFGASCRTQSGKSSATSSSNGTDRIG